MTSANRSEEPIVRGNGEALDRLPDLADAFLMHNREIVLRADDSIYRIIGGRPTVFRRSRGLAPGEFKLGEPAGDNLPVIVAAGGDMKCAPAVLKNDRIVPGPHVGDLASPVAQEYFKQSAQVLTEYLEAKPGLTALDPHPEYFSSSLAREMDTPVEEVFHHHAHAVSLLFESGLSGPALFTVFDGTGYGTDGTIWGGEFLVADRKSFSRPAHIGRYKLPGGEAAIKEPVRILAQLLAEGSRVPEELLPLLGDYVDRYALWLEAAAKGINAPKTSSVGRLFDAAAAAAGFLRRVTFEGEAAMWLEAMADSKEQGEYSFSYIEGDPFNRRSVVLDLSLGKRYP